MAKKTTGDKILITNDLGRTPPHAQKTEEDVLGALMLGEEALREAVEILKPECFYVNAHQKIYSAILELYNKNNPVNVTSVCQHLKNNEELDEVGGISFIANLTSNVDSTAHIEYDASIVVQKFIIRELIRVASEIQKRSYDESRDIVELIDFSENEIFKIAEGNIKKRASKLSNVVDVQLKQIQDNALKTDGLSGIPSSFTELDRITNGWQPSDLVIVAARPSMGKTAFVLSMARNVAIDYKRPIAFFSLEMSEGQLVNRLISSECEISSNKIRSGQLEDWEWQKLEQRINNLKDAQIFIDDTPSISITELRAKCRRLCYEHKIQLIIIDYLQLMTTGSRNENRQEEVATISRSLKGLAKELNIPIIALSQLNRGVETRKGSGRPMLSDLRESGSIEQDADIVLFIHRPEKYQIPEIDGESTAGLAEILISKHRNGATGDIKLHFNTDYAKFSDRTAIGLPDLSTSDIEKTAYPFKIQSKMNDDDDLDSIDFSNLSSTTKYDTIRFDEEIPY